ncbi:MAG: hypothetical protein R2686_01000 [Candidatus Nanopelagicales bacterium]
MTAANGGSVQVYNVQLAVSDDHVHACQAHQSASDQAAERMLTAAVPPGRPSTATTGTPIVTTMPPVRSGIGVVSRPTPGAVQRTQPDRGRSATMIATGSTVTYTNPAGAATTGIMTGRSHRCQRLADPAVREQYKRRGAPWNQSTPTSNTGGLRFSRRGLSAVTSELNLAATVVNLQRLHNRTRAAT